MRLIAIIVALFFANTALAEIPKPDYASLKEGVTFIYERADNSRYQSKLVSISPDGYVFESRNGEDGSGSFLYRNTYTQNGERLIWEGPEDTWVYKPHGCNREIGDCVYKSQKASGGKAYRNTISSKISDSRVTWKRYYNGNVVSNGWYEIDPETKWSVAFSWSSTNGGGETAKLVRIDQP